MSLSRLSLLPAAPALAAASPLLRREQINHWVGLLVLQGPTEPALGRRKGPLPAPAAGPSAAPRPPAGSPSRAGRLARLRHRTRLLSGDRAGAQIGAKTQDFKIAFLFFFFFCCC